MEEYIGGGGSMEVSWRSFCQSDVRIPNFLTWQESYTYTLWAKKSEKKCNCFWDVMSLIFAYYLGSLQTA